MKEYKPFKSGKVREVYDIGDSIVMVATHPISAFDPAASQEQDYPERRCSDTDVPLLV